MRDQYRALMLTSLKDAMEIVMEFNEWGEAEFDVEGAIPPPAVPQLALMLYQARLRDAVNGDAIDVPEFDDRMYE